MADDPARVFAEAVETLRGEIPAGADVATALLDIFNREADAFGEPRCGDDSPAVRLLALDGLLTDALGSALVGDDRDRELTRRLARRVAEAK